MLYGEGGIGGAINVIPRKPQREQSGDVRVIAGEDGTQFLGVDYTNALGDSAAFRIDYSNSQSDNWVEPNGDSEAEMLAFAVQWDVSDDLVLSARVDSGDQDAMRYFGIPNENGDFVRDFVGMNFNVSDSVVSYEDDSIRVKAEWQASGQLRLGGRAVSADVRPDVEERGGVLLGRRRTSSSAGTL